MKPVLRALALPLLMLASQARADFQVCPTGLIDPQGAEPAYRHEVTLSPYTHHWSHSDKHKSVRLLGLSEELRGGYFCGASLFSNSFGQPSVTAYVGKTWDGFWPTQPKVYGKLAAGLMYGYKGEHKNDVPLNYRGFSPLVVPSIGYRFSAQDAAEMQVLGTAALMFSYVRRF